MLMLVSQMESALFRGQGESKHTSLWNSLFHPNVAAVTTDNPSANG